MNVWNHLGAFLQSIEKQTKGNAKIDTEKEIEHVATEAEQSPKMKPKTKPGIMFVCNLFEKKVT